jgi:hypothetical protein
MANFSETFIATVLVKLESNMGNAFTKGMALYNKIAGCEVDNIAHCRGLLNEIRGQIEYFNTYSITDNTYLGLLPKIEEMIFDELQKVSPRIYSELLEYRKKFEPKSKLSDRESKNSASTSSFFPSAPASGEKATTPAGKNTADISANIEAGSLMAIGISTTTKSAVTEKTSLLSSTKSEEEALESSKNKLSCPRCTIL